ncbi:ABC transporter ATP-binding protein [Rhodococcus sp. NPDC003382]|uniref:ABC transporter ATP-binding protein n=1 Tax=unclassified Rhodococcus (in: high G+C Gram-positive bacteria) TaxID=192944 RepID=UPI0018CCBB37|nr:MULTISPECIES: ATP-binding cassette domain-containing protein [unclassified Rhodococcus (in: high G+C Gram-positive bacteria)]MBH0118912.1 ATP-binding cassette domain-containing protein [Rhodococcus sp. CX]
MGTLAVRVVQGYKSFPGRTEPVLDGVDLDIDTGEFLVVLGSSGSGKSTLLRIVAGLDRLDRGAVTWPESDDAARPHTGVVFQQPLLMPWLTVRENVAFGGRFAAHRDRFDPAYADELLDTFGLAGLAGYYPDQLSGGQAQRVAVVRAVAVRPRLLLLDEPFSALDPAIRADLQDWLSGLARDLGFTTVLVTHDIDEALSLADRIALLGSGGRVQQQWHLDHDGITESERQRLRTEILARYRDTALEIA